MKALIAGTPEPGRLHRSLLVQSFDLVIDGPPLGRQAGNFLILSDDYRGPCALLQNCFVAFLQCPDQSDGSGVRKHDRPGDDCPRSDGGRVVASPLLHAFRKLNRNACAVYGHHILERELKRAAASKETGPVAFDYPPLDQRTVIDGHRLINNYTARHKELDRTSF